MQTLFYPTRYLLLQDENKSSMLRRDMCVTLLLVAFLSAPFLLIPDANFFGIGGFLDRSANLFSALAGFYVAALVAAATISRGTDLDKPISVGEIVRPEDGARLSRREFVCAIFGYLAFLAFALTVLVNAIVAVAGSRALQPMFANRILEEYAITYHTAISTVALVVILVPISHLFVVTCYGLYYLIKRLYEQNPKVVRTNDHKNRAA